MNPVWIVQKKVMSDDMMRFRKTKLNPYRLQLTLLALPFFLLVILFAYVPIAGWALAFFNYRPGIRFHDMDFVGLKYFKLIGFFWADVQNSLINTLVFSGLHIILLPLPAIFAIQLTELNSLKTKKVIQTTVTLPNFISWIIVYSLCTSIFAFDGYFNQFLEKLGFEITSTTTLLGNKNLSWYFMTALGVWKGLGWSSIIYLAAIAGIDRELYEAAAIDGANRFQCNWHITIPGLMPTFFVLFLLQIGSFLSVGFEQYFVFANSLTRQKLEVIDLFTYRIGIGTQDYSFATAIGILRSLISIAMMFSMNSLSKRIREVS
ncbi:MAG: ABC transporter permease subunit, partial [Bacillota bacterium]|nr:ABC transporter permease subunit [Bacillota bacterium]